MTCGECCLELEVAGCILQYITYDLAVICGNTNNNDSYNRSNNDINNNKDGGLAVQLTVWLACWWDNLLVGGWLVAGGWLLVAGFWK